MQKATVCRIRPVSWKICVQGKEGADYVRGVLNRIGVECSQAVQAPELQEPPVFAFIAAPKAETPFTALELQAIFEKDVGIEVAFED
jgi:hypothetical protein